MTVDPARAAVLALHWQRDIVTPGGAFGATFSDMVTRSGVIPRTAGVLAAARAAGIAVFHAQVGFAPGHTDVVQNNPLFEQTAASGALVRGSSGADIIEELAPHPGDAVVEHTRMSAFFATDLKERLDRQGLDTVALTGVATNVIVEGTARDAMNLGLDVIVLHDCCTAATEAMHQASLATLELIARGTTSAEQFVSSIGGTAR